MPEFVLQPCRHRSGKLSVDKRREPLVLTVEELFDKFGLSKTDQLDQIRVQHMKVGIFVGISIGRISKKPVCFVLAPPKGSNSYEWLLVKDPSFDNRIKEVYRIEKALWDARIEEVPA